MAVDCGDVVPFTRVCVEEGRGGGGGGGKRLSVSTTERRSLPVLRDSWGPPTRQHSVLLSLRGSTDKL